MSIVLYKAGNSNKIRGIQCEVLICDEYSYLHNLNAGYFLSPEECYAEVEEEEIDVAKTEKAKADYEAAEKTEKERQLLLEKAVGCDLSPHPKTGIPKLEKMIADHEALQSLKFKALDLGLGDVNDLEYDELKELIDEAEKEKVDAE